MELKRVRLTTEQSSEFDNQVYFKDYAKVVALTATIAVPVLFNSFSQPAAMETKYPQGHSAPHTGTTTNFDYIKSSRVQVQSNEVSVAELARTLFPKPVELSGEMARKHRTAISSFFKKS